MEIDINKILEKMDSLDMKILLNYSEIDNREILNSIRLFADDIKSGWENYIDYLRSEDWQSEECFKAESDYYEIKKHILKLQEKLDTLLSECHAGQFGYIEKDQLENIDNLDILHVMKGSVCDEEVKRWLIWTNRITDANLCYKNWEKEKLQQNYSLLIALRSKLSMIYDAYVADSLEYKMESLKNRWKRVGELNKKVDITETKVIKEKEVVTNVVYTK